MDLRMIELKISSERLENEREKGEVSKTAQLQEGKEGKEKARRDFFVERNHLSRTKRASRRKAGEGRLSLNENKNQPIRKETKNRYRVVDPSQRKVAKRE